MSTGTVNKGAEAYKLKGNEAFKAGEHGKAIEFYTYATEMDPNNAIYYTNRSNAYFKMQKYDKSLRDAAKSVQKNPKWHKGHYRAGLAQMALDDAKSALVSFKSALDLDPDNQTYKQEIARAKAGFMKGMSQAEILKTDANELFKNGDIDKAIKGYTTAINASKKGDEMVKADCYANRAACYRQLYKDQEVVADCTAAIELNPNHAKAYIRRAQGYESQEKYKNALEDFQKASILAPNTPVAYQGASRVRSALKKMGKM